MEIHYPESDGKPLGETGFHVNAILSLHAAFLIAFRGRSDVYVASDMFLYYEQGNPRAVKAPDVMVIQNTQNHERRTFKLWVENVVPSTIFEITSDETRREDATTKPEVYARIGVPEYFLFDPLGDYLDPPMQGYRLDGGRYTRIAPDEAGNLPSMELGLRFRPEGNLIRVIDQAGQPIPSVVEMMDELEGVVRESEAEKRKRAVEFRRAQRYRNQAKREKARAEAFQAEIERLKAMLGERGGGPGE